jgi:hypothetical protein
MAEAAAEAGRPAAPVRLVPLGQQDADGKPVWLYRFARTDGGSCPVGFCSDKGELDEYLPGDQLWLSIDGEHDGARAGRQPSRKRSCVSSTAGPRRKSSSPPGTGSYSCGCT